MPNIIPRTNDDKERLKEGESFLSTLDSQATSFHFRTFDDVEIEGKKRSNPALSKNFHGPLSAHFEPLCRLNEQGAGVFVVINAGGQTKSDITRIRAVFADTDGAPLTPIVESLLPHIVVQSSPGKWHVYYRVEPHFPLDKFGAVQSAIAHKYRTDGAVKDLPRVMRLPGFMHNKGKPCMVTTTHLDIMSPAYSLDRVVSGLGLTLVKRETGSIREVVPAAMQSFAIGDEWKANAHPARKTTLDDAEYMLRFIDPDCDRGTWWKVMGALVHEFGEDARDLARRWSMGQIKRGAV